jgi:hypothetical protein
MKFMVNRRPVQGPWGGGNLFVKAICNRIVQKGHSLVHNLEKGIDAIIIVDPRNEGGYDTIRDIIVFANQNNVKTLLRVNECDARKGTNDVDEYLRQVSLFVNKTVFVSNWMRDYHVGKGWKCSDNSVIYNGVNREIFRPLPKLRNGKINLVTHHWSNNKMKGFDVYDVIDDLVGRDSRYSFTYIGRDRGTFRNTRVIPPLFGRELGDALGVYVIYISASIADPGPNHVIESIACGMPTYSISGGGGSCEFTGDGWIYNGVDDLMKMIANPAMNIDPFSEWSTCADRFLDLLS